MNKFKKEDIDLILNHPDVQTTQVLSDLIGESMQLMHVWKKLGISDAGLKKINSCDYLVNLDLSKKTDNDIDTDALCIDFVESLKEKPMIKSMFNTQDRSNWKRRGRVSVSAAVIMNQVFDVSFSDSRPDKPLLYWPPVIEKHKELAGN